MQAPTPRPFLGICRRASCPRRGAEKWPEPREWDTRDQPREKHKIKPLTYQQVKTLTLQNKTTQTSTETTPGEKSACREKRWRSTSQHRRQSPGTNQIQRSLGAKVQITKNHTTPTSSSSVSTIASSSPPIDEFAEPTRLRRGAMFSGDMEDKGFPPSPEASIPPTPRREGACRGKHTGARVVVKESCFRFCHRPMDANGPRVVALLMLLACTATQVLPIRFRRQKLVSRLRRLFRVENTFIRKNYTIS